MMKYAELDPKPSATMSTKAAPLSSFSPKTTALQRVRMTCAQDVHVLQAMAGNRAVGQLLAGNKDQDQGPESGPSSLPSQLKSGIEQMSGMDMSDVKVHANSNKPAQVGALAFTSGNNIYVQPGQERHLPHEAWHAVQQKTGQVQPTTQLAGVPVNDNASLENEADVMGARALQTKPMDTIQCSEADDEEEMVQAKGDETVNSFLKD